MSNPEHPKGYEKVDIDLKRIGVIGILGVALLVVILVGLDQWFTMASEEVKYEFVLVPENPALRDLMAAEQETLTKYKVIDTATHVYQIPIERAMELLVSEEQRKN